MFPFRDHNPSGRTPYVTYALIAINIAVFASYFTLFTDERALAGFFNTWALIPADVSRGSGISGLITSMFLHGGLLHLAGNMLFLWIFGDNIEDEMGHIGYLLFYLAAGIAAGLAQVISEPFSHIPTVGASGAIAGVMGGYLLLFPRARIDILLIFIVFFRVITVPAWVMLGVWFALQLLSGVATDTASGGIAYWAHAGGFFVGVLLTLPVFLRRGGTAFWRRTHGTPPHPEAEYELSRSRIPRVKRKKL
jgi:membrane associated rhomboid family serine protease